MEHYAAAAINRKESATVALLDVARVFNRVWHPELLHKVFKAGTPYHVTHVLADYLHDGEIEESKV